MSLNFYQITLLLQDGNTLIWQTTRLNKHFVPFDIVEISIISIFELILLRSTVNDKKIQRHYHPSADYVF